VKDLVGINKQKPPRTILNNGKTITSLRKICNIANSYFNNKINTLRNKFTFSEVTPIDILSKLVPKISHNLQFKHIDQALLKDTFNCLKPTNSLGNNKVSMRTLKKLQDRLSPYIIHLINNIIDTEIYLDIFKTDQSRQYFIQIKIL